MFPAANIVLKRLVSEPFTSGGTVYCLAIFSYDGGLFFLNWELVLKMKTYCYLGYPLFVYLLLSD